MRLPVSAFAVLPFALLGAGPATSEPASAEARLFAEGTISTGEYESHPCFAPDNRSLYFVKSTPGFDHWTIVESRRDGDRWGRPEVVEFSGRWRDADPFLTPDGARLYFISDRPASGKAGGDLDLWFVEKRPQGCGEPVRLGAPANSPGNEWFPCIAPDGSLYFGSDRPGGRGRTDLYRAAPVEGGFGEPENLGDAVNRGADEDEPRVSRDGALLVFMATGRPGGKGRGDLFVSRRSGDSWSPAENPGAPIHSPATEISPSFSPDGKTFFWSSARGFADTPRERRFAYEELSRRLGAAGNGLGDIYSIDASALGGR